MVYVENLKHAKWIDLNITMVSTQHFFQLFEVVFHFM